MREDVPDVCEEGNHEFKQGGRCRVCGIDRADTIQTERRTGGAGARTQPLSDKGYRRRIMMLENNNAVDSEGGQ